MSQMNVALATIGTVVLLIGLWSRALKRSPFQEPLVAVLVGIAVGPYGLGWLDPARWGEENAFLEHAARLTLAVALMGVALRLHKDSLRIIWRPAAVLLTVGMLGMWLASSALAGWLFGLSLWGALLIGAVVTPTDPVVASSIVTGEFARQHLPRRVRDTISLESGANDGLAYIFVMLPILMMQQGPDEAWHRWLVESLLVGVALAVVVGAAIGYAGSRLLTFVRRLHSMENQSFLSYSVALSLTTLGVAALLRADALISVFVAGVVFNICTDTRQEHEEENVQEAIAKLFTMPAFVVFGLALPLTEWAQAGWSLLALAVLVLLLRRLPVVVAAYPGLRSALNLRDAVYMGWFGPIGIAALYYAAFARAHVDDPLVWHLASALIFASILVHGLTAAPLTRVYARDPGRTPVDLSGVGEEAG